MPLAEAKRPQEQMGSGRKSFHFQREGTCSAVVTGADSQVTTQSRGSLGFGTPNISVPEEGSRT